MIQCKINVQDIPKDKLYKGEKGIYLNCKVVPMQSPDKYENTHTIYIQAEKGDEKIYIGKGKEVKFNAQPGPQNQVTDHDDLPF